MTQQPLDSSTPDPEVVASLDELRMQESTVTQILQIIDEAGRLVSEGAPAWVDPDVFGTNRQGERMARHTLSAQTRVQEALHMALAALAQHHGSLGEFREVVRRVDDETVSELAVLRSRVDTP